MIHSFRDGWAKNLTYLPILMECEVGLAVEEAVHTTVIQIIVRPYQLLRSVQMILEKSLKDLDQEDRRVRKLV